uniref:Uncharacterized protein n=1 Tax=Rhizophora mucronata TaxID=61149 RepID=A0A2P2PHF4_RHIMU
MALPCVHSMVHLCAHEPL